MSAEPMVVASQVPTHWHKLAADLPEPTPPALHPGTREPLGPDDLIPAPESTHAVAGAMARARAATTDETIVLGLSGNGVLDLPAYEDFL